MLGSKAIKGLTYLDVFLKNSIIAFIRKCLFKTKQSEVNKILLFRNGYIGDILCALPSIAAIRQQYPNAEIDFLSKQSTGNMLWLKEFLAPYQITSWLNYHDKSYSLIGNEIRNNKYDLVIELTQVDASFIGQIRNIFYFRFYAVKNAFGWHIFYSHFFKRWQLENVLFLNERIRLLTILDKYAIPVLFNDEYKLPIDFSHYKSFVFEKLMFTNNCKILALIIGGKRERNRWPVEYFEIIINYYTALFYKIILIGNEEDNLLANKLTSSPLVINFCGKATLMESAALINEAKLVIANDTGPMHIAYMLNRPLVAMFSSRDFPGKWFPPINANSIVLQSKSIICALCFNKKCFDNVCMQYIHPNDVIKASEKLLN